MSRFTNFLLLAIGLLVLGIMTGCRIGVQQ